MSKKVKVELNRDGVKALLKGEEMQTVLNKYATDIKNRCGNGFEQDMHLGRNRANCSVFADTRQARSRNLRENTILRALR